MGGVHRQSSLAIQQEAAGPSTGDTSMAKLSALTSFLVLAASSALAQTPPATTPGTPPAGDAAASGGGIADYWWIILLVVVVAIAIWYFTRGRSTRV